MTMRTLNLEITDILSYVLGSELWESKFDGLFSLVKEYIVDVHTCQPPEKIFLDIGSNFPGFSKIVLVFNFNNN